MTSQTRTWMIQKAKGKYGLWILAMVAFFEATILLLPVDVILLVLVPLSIHSWQKLAFITTLSSTLGGVSGYIFGYFAWQNIALPLLTNVFGMDFVDINGKQDLLLPSYLREHFAWLLQGNDYLFEAYENIGFLMVFLFAIIPLPYRLIAMSSGAASMPLSIFALASLAGRGLRFAVVSWTIHHSYHGWLSKLRLFKKPHNSMPHNSIKEPSQKTRRR